VVARAGVATAEGVVVVDAYAPAEGEEAAAEEAAEEEDKAE
jgi:hypothetical protein